jgi:hypothetical protein
MEPQKLETADLFKPKELCRTKVCKEKTSQTRNIKDFCQFWELKDT